MRTIKLSDDQVLEIGRRMTDEDVRLELRLKLRNNCVDDVSPEEISTVKLFYEDGWDLIPCFYGEQVQGHGTKLRASCSWFQFNGAHKDNIYVDEGDKKISIKIGYDDDTSPVSFVACVNHDSNKIWLYTGGDNKGNDPHLLATFDCFYDLRQCLKQLDDYVPSTYVFGLQANGIIETLNRFSTPLDDDDVIEVADWRFVTLKGTAQ